MVKNKPKILVIDIETSPILAHVWQLFDNNVALNQIHTDWHILSVAYKWLGDPESKVFYIDQSNSRDIENDKKILKRVWKLLDDCDVVLTQNGKRFDIKKLNARFILNGMNPPSPFRHIDTLVIAKKHFGFTSNKLEYMTKSLCNKNKKSSHKKFSGFELWRECLAKNKEAWEEMKHYNIMDILSLEELYVNHLRKWDNTFDANVYHNETSFNCVCGSSCFISKGYNYSSIGKFKRHKCKSCGKHYQSKTNLLSKEKKQSLLK